MRMTGMFFAFFCVSILVACQPLSFSAQSLSNVNSNGFQLKAVSSAPPSRLTPIKKPVSGKRFRLHFNTKPIKNPKKPKHIQISENGSFELLLQAGTPFKLLDANATDGRAMVQLPPDVYRGYLRLAGLPATQAVRSLGYEDPLYKIVDTLGRNDGHPRPNGSFNIQTQNASHKLDITPRCSEEPESYRIWQIYNPQSEPVLYDWEIKNSDQEGTEEAPPGLSYLETETEPGNNVLRLTVANKKQDSQASKADRCAPGQESTADTSRWWDLGSRILPIPAEWQSPQADALLLKLNNQGVTDFTMRWVRTPGQAVPTPPPVFNGTLPELVEKENTGQLLSFQTPAVDSTGKVCMGLFPAHLYCLNPDGTPAWEASLEGPPGGSLLIDSQNWVFAGSYQRVQAFTNTGSLIWVGYPGSGPVAGMALSLDEKTLYVASEMGQLTALQRNTGSQRWMQDVDSSLVTTPLIDAAGAVYLGTRLGVWYRIEGQTGRVLWTFQGDGDIAPQSAPALFKRFVYLPQGEGVLYALRDTGQHLWTWRGPGKIVGSPLVTHDGFVYVLTQPGKLFRLDPNGKVVWQADLGEPAAESSPVLDQEGWVYLAGRDHLMAYDAQGQEKLKQPLAEDISAGLNLTPEGVLIVTGVSGRVRFYQTPGSGLASEGWPKFAGQVNNRGFEEQ